MVDRALRYAFYAVVVFLLAFPTWNSLPQGPFDAAIQAHADLIIAGFALILVGVPAIYLFAALLALVVAAWGKR